MGRKGLGSMRDSWEESNDFQPRNLCALEINFSCIAGVVQFCVFFLSQ